MYTHTRSLTGTHKIGLPKLSCFTNFLFSKCTSSSL